MTTNAVATSASSLTLTNARNWRCANQRASSPVRRISG
jgi:hypothetical protein